MPFWKKKIKKGRTYRKNNYMHTHVYSIKRKNPKRAVLSASMTLESVFIIPIFVFCSLILVYVINLINFQNRINEIMYDVSRNLSKMEYAAEGSANLLTASAMLYGELDSGTVNKMGVSGGMLGITSISSDFDEDMIRFVVNYTVNPPFNFLNIIKLHCIQKVSVRKWIGNEDKGGKNDYQSGDTDRMVYITETGTVYHTNRNCTHLVLSTKTVEKEQITNLRNASGGKYYACDLCGKESGANHIVYITDYGDRFHENRNCSGLKRGILAVPLSSVAGRAECSRCGK